jgi:Helicase conserved C-terminal domain
MPSVDLTAADAPGLSACSATLERYADPLLRAVAGRWLRLRPQWPAQEVRDRLCEALGDPVVVDRTLKTVSPVARRLLKLIGVSRCTRWRLRALADLLAVLDSGAGLAAVQELLDAGLMYPELAGRTAPVANLSAWLQQAATQSLAVVAVPLAAARAKGEDLALPSLPHEALGAAVPQEADGYEWLLRLAVAWQFVGAAPLRRTQQGGLFKRDLDRLQAHPLLSGPPADQVHPVPDPEMLAIELARAEGVLKFEPDQIRVGELPAAWDGGLGPALLSLWSAWSAAEGWDPVRGAVEQGTGAAAVATLVLAAFAAVPPGDWVRTADIDTWLGALPDVSPETASAVLLGIGYQLRLVQATRHRGAWFVRLGPIGRAVADIAKTVASDRPAFEQTLLVQPNLEVVLYRQGLTPPLLARLTRFAEFETLGPACTLALNADSVYRGLESGETLADIVRLLERHGTRAVSETVLRSLRSWASKRERVLVYPSAVILEFRTEADLERAMRQGVVEQKLTDRIGLVASEDRINYGQLRLVGTRDYLAPDERCVELNGDGLTVTVNEHKSDLLLASELARFAEPIAGLGADDRPRYRMTPETLLAARKQGLDVRTLNGWFLRRSGEPLSATAKLLLAGDEAPPPRLEHLTVLRLPTAELADGLAAWAETRDLVRERLAPTVLAIPADAVEPLRARLAVLGVRVEGG